MKATAIFKAKIFKTYNKYFGNWTFSDNNPIKKKIFIGVPFVWKILILPIFS